MNLKKYYKAQFVLSRKFEGKDSVVILEKEFDEKPDEKILMQVLKIKKLPAIETDEININITESYKTIIEKSELVGKSFLDNRVFLNNL